MMDAPYQAAPDVHVLPTNLHLPGADLVLPVNAYVLMAEEPVLIDTGIGVDSDGFLDALASVVDLAALRWVWLPTTSPITQAASGGSSRLRPSRASSQTPSARCGWQPGGRSVRLRARHSHR